MRISSVSSVKTNQMTLKSKEYNHGCKKEETRREADVPASRSRLELLEAINKSKSVMDDTLECGSAWCHDVHDANNKLREIARKLGYKQENWYCQFTL